MYENKPNKIYYIVSRGLMLKALKLIKEMIKKNRTAIIKNYD